MDRRLAWIVAATLAPVPVAAEANIVPSSFETTDGVFTVPGDLTTADTLDDTAGGYDVTAISGTVAGPGGDVAISRLVANSDQPAPNKTASFVHDNVVYGSAPFFDSYGLLFTAGAYDYRLFIEDLAAFFSSHNPAGNFDPGQAVGSHVLTIPEPATWLIMGFGSAALGLGGRRARRQASRAAFE